MCTNYYIYKKFEEIGACVWAFWYWNYLRDSPADFNLIIVTKHGNIEATKYFEILKTAVANS